VRSMTFAEFLGMPAGTLFGQDYAVAHRDEGLWSKRDSYPADDRDDEGFKALDLTFFDDAGQPASEPNWITEGMLEETHRFLVYEVADLDRLAGLVERARVVARGDS
jgi:hypothetical protein